MICNKMNNMELRALRIKMNVHGRFLQLLSEIFLILYLVIQGHILCHGGFNAQFIDHEEEALLKFREGLQDPSNRLSCWEPSQDHCQWRGVGCNKTTGQVISLDIHSPDSSDKLFGELSSSLLELPYLSYLDLSGNTFMQNVPEFLGSLHNLEYLNLSDTNFRGTIPNHLGNLSQLKSLDLSHSKFYLSVNNLNWLSRLSSLEELDMSEVDLSNAKNWFNVINMLPSLVVLRLSTCRLPALPLHVSHVNITSLKILDLSSNGFYAKVPDWLFEIGSTLQYLNLSRNELYGEIPDKFENLKSLAILDLSNNNLSGPIPSTLGQTQSQKELGMHSSLKELHLSNNHLSGRLEEILLQFSELIVLDIAENDLEGIIDDVHLTNFSSLRVLDFSSNHLKLNVSKNWIPPFKLETIRLRSIELGPQFPNWLQSQKNFSYIDLSHANISGLVPDWFWSLSSRVEYMNLSRNSLSGCGLNFSSNLKLHTLVLKENYFHCPLPHLSPSLEIVELAWNNFFGPVSHVCDMLGVNSSLNYLDLSANNLTGSIPDCWTTRSRLVILDLSNNSLTGQIPDSIGDLVRLSYLNLRANKLSRKIPASLQNCVSLYALDVSSNQLSGNIPAWIGESLHYVEVLLFRHNVFEGIIPLQLCQLKLLKFLDIAENHLFGSLPTCLFDAMALEENDLYDPYNAYRQSMMLLYDNFRRLRPDILYWKGSSYLFSLLMDLDFIGRIRLLDLSSNELSGTIPREIAKFTSLMSLNLSNNQLVGSIPTDIGEIKNLVALDLSRNQLSCTIPTSMADLLFLEYLNLSYNTLSGKIPDSNQFLTFDASSYLGNPHLCGLPLNRTCLGNELFEELQHCSDSEGDREHEHEHDGNHEDNSGWLDMSPFYISMSIGFFSGFWVFWGSLILIKSWRYAYFRFLGNMNDMIYVTVAVALAKLQRKFQGQQVPDNPTHGINCICVQCYVISS